MKKKIIISILILIALICGGLLLKYFLSFKNVTINLSDDTSSLTIFNSNNIEIHNIKDSQTIKIQTGNYIFIPEGEKISSDAITVVITKHETINIDPDYSNIYLESILETEKTKIQKLFNDKYPNIITNYTIKNYQLFKKGEWFGGILVKNNSSFNNKKDTFRFVAKKTDGVWEIINYPDLILTAKDYPDVPLDILNEINSIDIEY